MHCTSITAMIAVLLVSSTSACAEYPYDPPIEGSYDAVPSDGEVPWSLAQREFTEGLASCGAVDNLHEGATVTVVATGLTQQYDLHVAPSAATDPFYTELVFRVRFSDNDGGIGPAVLPASAAPIEARVEGTVHGTFGHIQLARRFLSNEGTCGDQFVLTW